MDSTQETYKVAGASPTIKRPQPVASTDTYVTGNLGVSRINVHDIRDETFVVRRNHEFKNQHADGAFEYVCGYILFIDLDEVASCANNKFLQRYYYGKIMERGGEMKARMDCLDNGDITRGEMECNQQKLICSFGQDLVRSLPKKANEYCGQSASGAVKRVLRHLYEVQTPLITLLGGGFNEADCKLVPADLFI
ncbi:hypothetical protein FSP39_024592 [Pinctada imbricata]|uniref:Uncharacterized protein n=1 Tax=Pinctada imbricata TaxID=66713 RepID=A0AA88YFQ3_PINIB|nr:hypothetical protein FSP39_024592 [Pinctada imbricata]